MPMKPSNFHNPWNSQQNNGIIKLIIRPQNNITYEVEEKVKRCAHAVGM